MVTDNLLLSVFIYLAFIIFSLTYKPFYLDIYYCSDKYLPIYLYAITLAAPLSGKNIQNSIQILYTIIKYREIQQRHQETLLRSRSFNTFHSFFTFFPYFRIWIKIYKKTENLSQSKAYQVQNSQRCTLYYKCIIRKYVT